MYGMIQVAKRSLSKCKSDDETLWAGDEECQQTKISHVSMQKIFGEVLAQETNYSLLRFLEKDRKKEKSKARLGVVYMELGENHAGRDVADNILRRTLRSSQKRESVVGKRAKIFEETCMKLKIARNMKVRKIQIHG